MCRRFRCCLVWALQIFEFELNVLARWMFFWLIIWKLRKHITTLPASSLRVDRSTRPKFLVTSKHETKIELISHPRASGNRSLTNKLRQFIMLIALFWGLQNNTTIIWISDRICAPHKLSSPAILHAIARKKECCFCSSKPKLDYSHKLYRHSLASSLRRHAFFLQLFYLFFSSHLIYYCFSPLVVDDDEI